VRERNEKFQVGDPFLNTLLTRKLLMFLSRFYEVSGSCERIVAQDKLKNLKLMFSELQKCCGPSSNYNENIACKFARFSKPIPWLLKKK